VSCSLWRCSVLTPLGVQHQPIPGPYSDFQLVSYLHITSLGLIGVWRTGIRFSPELLVETKQNPD
jgi:hypothetical protein